MTSWQEVLQVPISDKGLSRDELMSVCEKMLKYSVNTHHARFYNQLHTGPDIYGLAGETVSDALNSNPWDGALFTLNKSTNLYSQDGATF